MGMLDLIADQIKNLKDTMYPPDNECVKIITKTMRILESMRIVLQEHEAILLYRFKTLNMDYHRKVDELYNQYQDSVEEDSLKGFLSPDERLVRVKRFGREMEEAVEKLREEFNIGQEIS